MVPFACTHVGLQCSWTPCGLRYWYLSMFPLMCLLSLHSQFFFPPKRYICAMKTMLPGAVECLDQRSGMLAAIGGGELRVYLLGFNSSSSECSLTTLFADLLGPHLPLVNLNGKQPNSAHFVSEDSIIISFVDVHPTGQSGVL